MLGKSLPHHTFASTNLKVLVFSVELSDLLNSLFPKEHVSFLAKTFIIGKWLLMLALMIPDWTLFCKNLLVKILSILVALFLVTLVKLWTRDGNLFRKARLKCF